jgi:cell division protease FtsH
MKYETIDLKQIDQIMEGKIPDPPEGWDDSGPGGEKKNDDDSVNDPAASSGEDSSIGGTAEQH